MSHYAPSVIARMISGTLVAGMTCALAACASAPAQTAVPAPPVEVITPDRKVGWILRLEQQRQLRDVASSAPQGVTAARTLRPARMPDLEQLALDPEPVIRRRAVVALGRVGLPEGLTALVSALQDEDAATRASAAFAIGLFGENARSAVAPLQAVLRDPDLTVRVRAIDALGLIGDPTAVAAIYAAASECAGHLAPLDPDDEEWPKSAEVEICRASLYAFVRLKSYDALANVALDPQGRPVSLWWPVAYALQRIGDARAAPALMSLTSAPGVNTVGFALRGLAALKHAGAEPIARTLAAQRSADIKVRVVAVRALGQFRGGVNTAVLLALLDEPGLPLNLRLEVLTALGATADRSAFDALMDALSDESPSVRSAALSAAARIDPDAFLVVLAGLGRDPHWSVRAALTSVLAGLPADRVTRALEDLADDADARVHGPALEALATLKAGSLTPRLFKALEATDAIERATAARLLGEARSDGAVPQLVRAYTRAQNDGTYAARAAIVEALAKFDGDAAKETLRLALADRAWPVRVRAAKLLSDLGEAASPERPAPTRYEPEFFESPELLRPPYSPHAFIDTPHGTIEVALHVVDAPLTTRAFIEHARAGFFNGVRVHRLVPGFVIQAGDPRGDGAGGPGFTLLDEFNPLPYLRGTVGMAHAGPDTAGSQWFIALSPQPHLDFGYTAFGQVVRGWDVLDRVSQWDAIERVRIWDGVEFK